MLNLPRRPLGNALDELKRLSALPSAAALGHVRLAGFEGFFGAIGGGPADAAMRHEADRVSESGPMVPKNRA